MTKEKVANQEVEEQDGLQNDEGNPSMEGEQCDNMAEEDNAADTMTDKEEESASEEQFEEPSPEEVIAVWRDKYMRLQAEFDNYRKRTLREKMDLVASGGADVLKNMLAVLDDMYRAVAASEKSEDIDALREGEKLVLQKFEEALKQKNVTEIKAVGEEFNADYHEAVARFAAGEEMKGKVIDVVQRGYMLGDKVLRYAKVVVGE
ncbi:MAG: nucleotide exchange factor GrpE [Alistipes sp.]|nr:nucleotide exchange factor GrpE [Alistipes sp.]